MRWTLKRIGIRIAMRDPVRTPLPLAAVSLGIAAMVLRCAAPYTGGPPAPAPAPRDPIVASATVAAALAATAAAKNSGGIPNATPTPVGPPADYASLDLLLAALYEGVSHDAEHEPNWSRLEPLFLPGARLTPPRPMGDPSFRALSFDEFREAVQKGMAARREQGKPTGFYESEIGREASPFGNMVQVFSAYEGRFAKSDPKPFVRGINSFQAVRIANERWAIVSIVWDTERPEAPIPEKLIRGN
jgi:hypothetical protein